MIKINSLFHSIEQEFDRCIENAIVQTMQQGKTIDDAQKVHILIERQQKIQKRLWLMEREILLTFDEIETISVIRKRKCFNNHI